jgi:hypothetical protein
MASRTESFAFSNAARIGGASAWNQAPGVAVAHAIKCPRLHCSSHDARAAVSNDFD